MKILCTSCWHTIIPEDKLDSGSQWLHCECQRIKLPIFWNAIRSKDDLKIVKNTRLLRGGD